MAPYIFPSIWTISTKAVKMGQGHRAGPSALYFSVRRAVKKAWKNDPVYLSQPIRPAF